MNLWLLLAIVAMLLAIMTLREHYVEREGPGLRPSFDGAEGKSWRSKIDAQIPIGGSENDYLAALQQFYDKVYFPLRNTNKTASPKDSQVEEFLNSNTFPNVSKDALRQIILSGFSIDRSGSAAAREQKQVKFQPTEALQPRDGVDQVYGHRKEGVYVPADPRLGQLPEGIYADTEQTEPSREGIWDDNSTSWSPAAFASVCEDPTGKCAQNVL
jgi:hypothetical protein